MATPYILQDGKKDIPYQNPLQELVVLIPETRFAKDIQNGNIVQLGSKL